MAPTLHVEYAGLELKNPFILASGPPTRDAGMLDRAFSAGWAGAVIKSIPSAPLMQRGFSREPRPLLTELRRGARLIGMGNISVTGEWRVEEWRKALPELKAKHPDCVVFASMGAEVVREDWQLMAQDLAEAGFDGLELDLSCTHATLGRDVPLIVGENPELTAQVVRWVTEVIDIPVIPKLPASVQDWVGVLEACRAAGAAGVASINSLAALMGVDLDTMTPLLSLGGYGSYCGYSGPGIKPVALRVISQIHKANVLPVSGIGGISTWRDATEFLLLGARSVQLCTEVMWSGYRIIKQLCSGLAGYLESKELRGVEDLIGLANQRVVSSVFDLRADDRLMAQIGDKCNQCGKCVIACWDGAHQAIIDRPGEAPLVDHENCVGCGLCIQVCPTGAIEWTSTV